MEEKSSQKDNMYSEDDLTDPCKSTRKTKIFREALYRVKNSDEIEGDERQTNIDSETRIEMHRERKTS